MPFVITIYALGTQPRLTITKKIYDRLIAEKKFLAEITFIEQKFDLLIENYIELENKLLSVATRNMVRNRFDHQFLSEQLLTIIRLVSNFLSSCRLYRDHTRHHISEISMSKRNFASKFKNLTTRKYNENIEYQTIEALRNYCQHRGFPVDTLNFSWRRDTGADDNTRNQDKKSTESLLFNVTPILDIEQLKSDRKFKQSVIKALEDNKFQKIDLMRFIRKYIGLISERHEEIRNCFDSDICNAKDFIREMIVKFERRAGRTKILGVAAIYVDRQNIQREPPIFLPYKWIEYLDALQKTNVKSTNVCGGYVTSKSP